MFICLARAPEVAGTRESFQQVQKLTQFDIAWLRRSIKKSWSCRFGALRATT